MCDYNEIIYKGLLEGNNIVLQKFFYGKFTAVLEKVIEKVFVKDAPFESARANLFNDLYVYLTENNCKRLRKYETEGNGDIIVWLTKMATKYYLNERNKHRKKQKRHHTSSLESKHEGISDIVDRSLEKKELQELIIRVCSLLKNKNQAEIVRRYFFDDPFDAKAIARDLNLTEGSIYPLLQRGLKKFKIIYSQIKDDQDEEQDI
jgi:RNA polymerase sigma factor (sigma-70 family)